MQMRPDWHYVVGWDSIFWSATMKEREDSFVEMWIPLDFAKQNPAVATDLVRAINNWGIWKGTVPDIIQAAKQPLTLDELRARLKN